MAHFLTVKTLDLTNFTRHLVQVIFLFFLLVRLSLSCIDSDSRDRACLMFSVSGVVSSSSLSELSQKTH